MTENAGSCSGPNGEAAVKFRDDEIQWECSGRTMDANGGIVSIGHNTGPSGRRGMGRERRV